LTWALPLPLLLAVLLEGLVERAFRMRPRVLAAGAGVALAVFAVVFGGCFGTLRSANTVTFGLPGPKVSPVEYQVAARIAKDVPARCRARPGTSVRLVADLHHPSGAVGGQDALPGSGVLTTRRGAARFADAICGGRVPAAGFRGLVRRRIAELWTDGGRDRVFGALAPGNGKRAGTPRLAPAFSRNLRRLDSPLTVAGRQSARRGRKGPHAGMAHEKYADGVRGGRTPATATTTPPAFASTLQPVPHSRPPPARGPG